jgi:hypothetical protein
LTPRKGFQPSRFGTSPALRLSGALKQPPTLQKRLAGLIAPALGDPVETADETALHPELRLELALRNAVRDFAPLVARGGKANRVIRARAAAADAEARAADRHQELMGALRGAHVGDEGDVDYSIPLEDPDESHLSLEEILAEEGYTVGGDVEEYEAEEDGDFGW